MFQAVPQAGFAVPSMSRVFIVSRLFGRVTKATAAGLAPVESFFARCFRVWHAFAHAAIIIKLIIGSALVSCRLHAAAAITFFALDEDFVLAAFRSKSCAEAVVIVDACFPCLGFLNTDQVDSVHVPTVWARRGRAVRPTL